MKIATEFLRRRKDNRLIVGLVLAVLVIWAAVSVRRAARRGARALDDHAGPAALRPVVHQRHADRGRPLRPRADADQAVARPTTPGAGLAVPDEAARHVHRADRDSRGARLLLRHGPASELDRPLVLDPRAAGRPAGARGPGPRRAAGPGGRPRPGQGPRGPSLRRRRRRRRPRSLPPRTGARHGRGLPRRGARRRLGERSGAAGALRRDARRRRRRGRAVQDRGASRRKPPLPRRLPLGRPGLRRRHPHSRRRGAGPGLDRRRLERVPETRGAEAGHQGGQHLDVPPDHAGDPVRLDLDGADPRAAGHRSHQRPGRVHGPPALGRLLRPRRRAGHRRARRARRVLQPDGRGPRGGARARCCTPTKRCRPPTGGSSSSGASSRPFSNRSRPASSRSTPTARSPSATRRRGSCSISRKKSPPSRSPPGRTWSLWCRCSRRPAPAPRRPRRASSCAPARGASGTSRCPSGRCPRPTGASAAAGCSRWRTRRTSRANRSSRPGTKSRAGSRTRSRTP